MTLKLDDKIETPLDATDVEFAEDQPIKVLYAGGNYRVVLPVAPDPDAAWNAHAATVIVNVQQEKVTQIIPGRR